MKEKIRIRWEEIKKDFKSSMSEQYTLPVGMCFVIIGVLILLVVSLMLSISGPQTYTELRKDYKYTYETMCIEGQTFVSIQTKNETKTHQLYKTKRNEMNYPEIITTVECVNKK